MRPGTVKCEVHSTKRDARGNEIRNAFLVILTVSLINVTETVLLAATYKTSTFLTHNSVINMIINT